METYIRNELSVGSDLTLEQAATHSVKLLHWLLDLQEQMQQQKMPELQLQLCYADIECIFKATIYLYEGQTRYGDALVDAVLQQSEATTVPAAAVQRFYADSAADRSAQIRELCSNIVCGTRNGHHWAPILQHMQKASADLQPAWSSIKTLNWAALKDSSKQSIDVTHLQFDVDDDALRMQHLVRRIFRLGSVPQIRTAVERAMQQLDVALWLQLFREPKKSILYTRCRLLRQLLCDLLVGEQQQEGNEASPAASGFMHNIYSFVAESSTHVARLWRSLLHVRFAQAVSSYLMAYWATQQLTHLDLEQLPQTSQELLYVTHLLLSPKSPCRLQLFGALRQMQRLQHLLELLNKVAYVYG